MDQMEEIIFSDLWNKILSIMNSSLPDREERIKVGGQPSAVEAREKGYRFSDNQPVGRVERSETRHNANG